MGEGSWPSASRCLPIHPPLLITLAWQRECFSLHCEGTQGRGRQGSRTHSSQRPKREPCAAQDPPQGSMWALQSGPALSVPCQAKGTSFQLPKQPFCSLCSQGPDRAPASMQPAAAMASLRPGIQREEEVTLVQVQESPCWVTRTASTWEAMRLALWGEAGGGALPR